MGRIAGAIDVHQHLWPRTFIDALRRSDSYPRLDGWTLALPGEPPFQVRPQDHDPAARRALDPDLAIAIVSLSSPLGIEALPVDVAEPLLDAYHRGAAALPTPFRAWAAVHSTEPDLAGLAARLADGFVGLQIPATSMRTPRAVERLAPVLRVCEEADKPVLVHPGPVAPSAEAEELPSWWPAVVDYTAQMTASWWSWQVAGRPMLPQLRICFVAGGGLAPVHHERFSVRGGGNPAPIDRLTFVETSSYGARAVDALVRVLGIDVVVNGTDRPYAGPTQFRMGDAADHAFSVANPTRLLEGGPA
ncbi:Predicted metal-dependent hydrolase, TIM-barrel fold [Nakamurella panacisegetis]|uniref:Predicted metal-dependent hydrolase, TIM-barrel fold n=1 Tax=Nakamurella panacisegetis TaxID=1090615 RepID=A0A1H0NWT2_9ACTN|nr:amidohydrolase family protein [Nakamurella panacisegetis]SDO96996.1 Predicted metal-dependent hydrolase, TIM-barrel fold [Nakamurella panacisegetis]